MQNRTGGKSTVLPVEAFLVVVPTLLVIVTSDGCAGGPLTSWGGRPGDGGDGGGVATPREGAPTTKNSKRFLLVDRGAALAPADPYTINIPRPRAPLTKPFCF